MAVLIRDIKARQIIDSRAVPTIETEMILDNGMRVFASVPSGASVGKTEAFELRDNNPSYLFSKSVLKAIDNIRRIILPELIGLSPLNQTLIDNILQELDGTSDFSSLGANATLSVSIATVLAASKLFDIEPYRCIGGACANVLPIPMINIINGGIHANNNLDIQEFMIVPIGAKNFREAMRMSLEVFHALKNILKKKKLSTNVGDEGGFAPNLSSNFEALDLILEAINLSGYTTSDIKLALDFASQEFYEDEKYYINNKTYTSFEMINNIKCLLDKYPIISIEDPLSPEDVLSWKTLTQTLGKRTLLVGDDLFTTNSKLLKNGINNKIANSIIIKPNQIGTITQTLETVDIAKRACYKTIVSHRSGDTECTFISDFSVGVNSPFIKIGALSRGERTAKYNRLLYIEESLGKSAKYGNNYI